MYLCDQLATDTTTGKTECALWVTYSNPFDISADDADVIVAAIIPVLLLAFLWNTLYRYFLGGRG